VRYILFAIIMSLVSCEVSHYHSDPYEDEYYYDYDYGYDHGWCAYGHEGYDYKPYYTQPATCAFVTGPLLWESYYDSCCVWYTADSYCNHGKSREEWCYSTLTCEWELYQYECI